MPSAACSLYSALACDAERPHCATISEPVEMSATYMPGALEQAWLQVPKGEACAFARNAVTQPGIALWLSATNHSRGEHPQSLPDEEVAQLKAIVAVTEPPPEEELADG